MAKISDILASKGQRVVSIRASASVLEAAVEMNQHQIGALVVTDAEQIVGIFTERDILRRVVAQQRDPVTTQVAQVMSTQVACCVPDTSIEEARAVMKRRRIRHLPVVEENGALSGMISIGDLNAYENDAQELTIHFLHEYLYGRV